MDRYTLPVLLLRGKKNPSIGPLIRMNDDFLANEPQANRSRDVSLTKMFLILQITSGSQPVLPDHKCYPVFNKCSMKTSLKFGLFFTMEDTVKIAT